MCFVVGQALSLFNVFSSSFINQHGLGGALQFICIVVVQSFDWAPYDAAGLVQINLPNRRHLQA